MLEGDQDPIPPEVNGVKSNKEPLQSNPRIRYEFSRNQNGAHHEARVIYGVETERGVRLAQANYKEGKLESVVLVNGNQDELLAKQRQKSRKRRSSVLGGISPYPSHEAVRLDIGQGDQINVYDDEYIHHPLGERLGTISDEQQFTHEAIPYILEAFYDSARNLIVRRVAQQGNSLWEFVVPGTISLEAEEFLIAFRIK